MPRRQIIDRRPVVADHKYNSVAVAKFIQHVMVDGKKSLAEKIVYAAFDIIQNQLKRDPLAVFEKALMHVRPLVELKTRRVGGATYQVPIELDPRGKRAQQLANRWIVSFARKRGEQGMIKQLAGELMDAADEESGGEGKGGAVKKREETHRMADANKAFAHYRW